jgi:glycosyltransferase involved in cell wall biosynthesis
MKILLLPNYFDPEIAASLYLSNNRNAAFTAAGFTLEVHVPTPTRGISKEIRKQYKQKKTESLYDGKMIVHRFPMFREGKNPLIRTIRYTLCCIIQFLKGCFSKNIDLIFVTSTPPIQGTMAAILKKVKKVPFIYNLQDIFPDSLVSTGLTLENSVIWRTGRIIENFIYHNADKIIVISEDFKRNIMLKGVPEKKIEVVYNWVNENEVVNIEREDNKLFDKYNLDRNKFYITYCGNIGLSQNIDLLLNVAKELEPLDDIRFVLIGEGVYKTKTLEIIRNNHIQNISVLPVQPYEDISYVFSLGDVGLVISKPNTGRNSLPSKTWSIMSAERPVLANFDENELKEIVENNHLGIFTKAGDKETLKEAILSFYHNPDKCMEMGKNGRDFVLKNLTRNIGTSKYINIVKQVVLQ